VPFEYWPVAEEERKDVETAKSFPLEIYRAAFDFFWYWQTGSWLGSRCGVVSVTEPIMIPMSNK
jgi:hypothetical protein